MTDQESFEDKLQRWTLNELLIEQTKTRIYGERKLGRIATRIAELQYGTGAAPSKGGHDQPFVASSRLDSLRALRSKQFDFQRLIRVCEEINVSWRHGNLIAVGALTRVLLDHVPPVFGYGTFAQVAANASRSTKAVFESLENNSRKISDGLLHQPIRTRETLPTEQTVNFSQNVDLLLAEVIRVVEEANA